MKNRMDLGSNLTKTRLGFRIWDVGFSKKLKNNDKEYLNNN